MTPMLLSCYRYCKASNILIPLNREVLVVSPCGAFLARFSLPAPSLPDMSSLLAGANLPWFGAGGLPHSSKPPGPEDIRQSME